MTTADLDLTTPTLPVDLIHVHPNNARWEAVADDEMVESIRSIGIAQALTLMPHVGNCTQHDRCYTLGAGHRRLDGAIKAGLAEVPVMLREDLVTDAQQLEFMLVENLHRSDLSPAEEAAAYEQLTLFGHDVDAIAAATGRKASTVRARLKLNGLGETTRERLHAGEMTLLDAEAMLEFAGNPKITAELEKAIGTPNFKWEVENARRSLKRNADRAAQIATLQETGATEVERDAAHSTMWHFPEGLRTPEAHDGCLAYVVPTSEWQDPYLVCTDPGKHPKVETTRPAREDSDWEKQRAEREERSARHAAAAAVRLTWLRDHFQGMFTAKPASPLAAAAKAFLPTTLHDGRWPEVVDDTLLLTALDAVPGDEAGGLSYEAVADVKAAYAAGLSRAKPGKVLETFAAWLAALVADQLSKDMQWAEDDAEVLHHLGLWDWLKSAGYEFSDVDKEIVTSVEVRHTELANEAEAS